MLAFILVVRRGFGAEDARPSRQAAARAPTGRRSAAGPGALLALALFFGLPRAPFATGAAFLLALVVHRPFFVARLRAFGMAAGEVIARPSIGPALARLFAARRAAFIAPARARGVVPPFVVVWAAPSIPAVVAAR